MLMLASGSTNYLQKASKTEQFSTKNAKNQPKIPKINRIFTQNPSKCAAFGSHQF